MRDEKIILRCRPGRIRGGIYFSDAGCLSIKFAELDTEIFNPDDYRHYQMATKNEIQDIRGDENIEREY